MTEAEVAAIRLATHRNRPFGCDAWTRSTAQRLGLESSLRARRSPTNPASEERPL